MATGLTTNYNIPYPLLSDNVNVHGDMQDMAETMDTLFGLAPLKSLSNTFTNTNIFEVNSSDPAVRITQTGSGYSLLVENASHPDSTPPLAITASGKVGIGKIPTDSMFEVGGNITSTGSLEGTSFIKTGGSSSQFLKADGTIDSTSYLSGIVAVSSGGTNISSYAIGDILYASASGVLSKLSIGSDGQVLKVSSGLPSWGAGASSSAATSSTLGTVYGYTEAGGAGNNNSFYGAGPTRSSLTGADNIAIGRDSFRVPTSASQNVVIGRQAAYSITTGTNNIILGADSALSLTTGSTNISIGPDSLRSNVTGGSNVSVGQGALYSSTGLHNVAVGTSSGNNLSSGDNNIFLGYNSQASGSTVSNEITLGNSNITKFRVPGLGIEYTSTFKPLTFVVNETAKTAGYTVELTDINTMIQMNGSYAITVPLNSTTAFPTSTQIHIIALTAGVTVSFTSGITYYATPGLKLRTAGSVATLIKLGTDIWALTGDLIA